MHMHVLNTDQDLQTYQRCKLSACAKKICEHVPDLPGGRHSSSKNRDNPENPGFSDIVASNIPKMVPILGTNISPSLKRLVSRHCFWVDDFLSWNNMWAEYHYWLGGGNSNIFYFQPYFGEDFHPFWRSYFSDGLVETTNWMGFWLIIFYLSTVWWDQGTNFWWGMSLPLDKPPHDWEWCTQKQPLQSWTMKITKNPKISSRDFDFTISTPGVFYQPYQPDFILPQNPPFFPTRGRSFLKDLNFPPTGQLCVTKSASAVDDDNEIGKMRGKWRPAIDGLAAIFFFHFNESRFTEPKTVRNDKLRSLNDARSNYM